VSPKAKDAANNNKSVVEPITSPSGLELNPKPPQPRRVSKRAAGAIGIFAFLLLVAFAYGGYKRTKAAQAKVEQAGVPRALAPATSAGNEFVNAIPPGNAAIRPGQQSSQLVAPDVASGDGHASACGTDPKTHQVYRFDPQTGAPCDRHDFRCGTDPNTGRPCSAAQPPEVQPVVVRRVAPSSAPQDDPEERRREEFARREQEAMQAPTAVHLAGSDAAAASSTGGNPTSQGDLGQVAALGAALSVGARVGEKPSLGVSGLLPSYSSPASTGGDYETQNMQSRKEQFLHTASATRTDDYLKSIRTAPLSEYEIKAGWEIPAILEQSLDSDLPGGIKALVMSNVYDTATGRYLLIPQGSQLIGQYDARVAYGQDGVQVVWNRLIFPDASSIDLSGMVGLDSHGNSGLRDKVDRHYKRLFGFAALTSAFTAAFDLSQRQNQNVLTAPGATQTASSAVGQELSETGAQITRRNLNVQPTIKVPAGYKFTVRVDRDILFDSPYEREQADPDVIQPHRGLRKRTTL
jgi:type IV secretion system protein TrbI